MADDQNTADADQTSETTTETTPESAGTTPAPETTKKTAKKRRSRKKAPAKRAAADTGETTADAEADSDAPAASGADTPGEGDEPTPAKKKSRSRRKKAPPKKAVIAGSDAPDEPSPNDSASDDSAAAARADDAPETQPEPESQTDSEPESDSETDQERKPEPKSKASKKPAAKRTSKKKPERRGRSGEATETVHTIDDTPSEMIINYTPGEECRIAIIEDGKLEEFNSEPTEHVSRVGNIYVGKVVNIERNIQAAFVDFGTEEAGFLHLSDLHPRYFPGADSDETERVGHKTPRRARPPIEQALKRGQTITVQVLKEGVGTKGPSLTSYLSIPGRYLVMMPDMDKVGVSRKVEDEDERRKMRQILDQLDLPEGFGFILRTAGMERTKTELKRDLAYLQRLWKDMERRRKKGGGSRLLYSESDLLLRTIRDRATKEVTRIVIDNDAALRRAGAFFKIVSPRATTKLCQYTGSKPIFHAFGIEEQLDLMHATEVPLPSGGRLIIEQTEALVAIDVNSGKSRGAKDAESNAFRTNIEAVDEICRQLRLRDLGGLVINDLIDMRHASNRKEVENRFKDRLKRDRARSTILPISAFGILEMTRQRMRGSFEQQHFQTCPRCTGRGLIQRPDSVAASALRDLAALLENDRVQRVELVVSPVVAGALLSTRRGTLGRIERLSGKTVDVRVSETMSAGRIVRYAYDANGNDIDIDRLPTKKAQPAVTEWADTDLPPATDGWAVDLEDEAETVRTALEEEATAHERAAQEKIAHLDLPGDEPRSDDAGGDGEGGKKKRKRRRRRRRKGDGEGGEGDNNAQQDAQQDNQNENRSDDRNDSQNDDSQGRGPSEAEGQDTDEGAPKKKRRRRRRRRKSEDDNGESTGEKTGENNGDPQQSDSDNRTEDAAPSEDSPKPKRRRRRAPKGLVDGSDAPPASDNGSPAASDKNAPDAEAVQEAKPAKRKRRSLYGASRRSLSASEKANADRDT